MNITLFSIKEKFVASLLAATIEPILWKTKKWIWWKYEWVTNDRSMLLFCERSCAHLHAARVYFVCVEICFHWRICNLFGCCHVFVCPWQTCIRRTKGTPTFFYLLAIRKMFIFLLSFLNIPLTCASNMMNVADFCMCNGQWHSVQLWHTTWTSFSVCRPF